MMTTHSDSKPGWAFWVDRGGTFTDLVARSPNGGLSTQKLLSERPEHYADAAAEAIRRILDAHPQFGRHIDEVRVGTTVATNALLEGKTPSVALVLTAGFEDLRSIADQRRDELFALHVMKRTLPSTKILASAGRMSAQGDVIADIDSDALTRLLREAYQKGIRDVAISLLHAWRNPKHELQCATLARKVGFDNVTLGHQVSPLRG